MAIRCLQRVKDGLCDVALRDVHSVVLVGVYNADCAHVVHLDAGLGLTALTSGAPSHLAPSQSIV